MERRTILCHEGPSQRLQSCSVQHLKTSTMRAAFAAVAFMLSGCSSEAKLNRTYGLVEYRPPVVGAQCFDPYMALGTSNTPPNSEVGTTVVNITAFVTDVARPQPVAIVTKTREGALWFITYEGEESLLSSVATEAPIQQIDPPGDLHFHIMPKQLTSQELKALVLRLKPAGIRKWTCFSHDLPESAGAARSKTRPASPRTRR